MMFDFPPVFVGLQNCHQLLQHCSAQSDFRLLKRHRSKAWDLQNEPFSAILIWKLWRQVEQHGITFAKNERLTCRNWLVSAICFLKLFKVPEFWARWKIRAQYENIPSMCFISGISPISVFTVFIQWGASHISVPEAKRNENDFGWIHKKIFGKLYSEWPFLGL